MVVMTQVVPEQKESCAAERAMPPAFIGLIFLEVPSERRVTSYKGPEYELSRARVVLCAATHGVLPAA